MAKILFADNAKTTLSGSFAQGATTLNVTGGGGARFPAPTGGDFFYGTLYQKDGNGVEINIEIVKISTKASADSFTVVQRDVTSITGYAGGYSYPSTYGTTYFELRWIEKDAAAMMQAADMMAANVANTPAGNIAATTVQAALNELDTEKAALASPAFTGTPTIGGVNAATTGDVSTAVTNERSASATLTNKTLNESNCKIGALTGIAKLTAGAPSVATAADIVTLIGATAVQNASAANSATAAGKLSGANWTVEETAGVLYFKYGGVGKAKLDSSGNLTVAGNITAGGTV